jgi:Protein of unknown function
MRGTADIDSAILKTLTPHWAKVAMVAVRAMEQLNLPSTDENFDSVCRRIAALVEEGVIDAQGDVSLPRYSEVRAL